MQGHSSVARRWIACLGVAAACVLCLASAKGQDSSAVSLVQETGIRAGLVVHIGNGGPESTVALAKCGEFVVHRLVTDPSKLDEVRKGIRGAGVYGKVSAEVWRQADLPYAERLVNIVVADAGCVTPDAEILRALAPRGTGLIRKDGGWRKVTKPVLQGMDDWRTLKRGIDGNPVSRDDLAFRKVPNNIRWVNASLVAGSSALRLADGLVFINFGDHMVARDAFNGIKVWEGAVGGKPVICKDRIYTRNGGTVTDAKTGKSLAKFDAGAPYEFTVADDVVLSRTKEAVQARDGRNGKLLWEKKVEVMDTQLKPFRNTVPAVGLQHLVVGGSRVYFTGYEPAAGGADGGPEAVLEPGADLPATPSNTNKPAKAAKTPSVFGVDFKTGKQEWMFRNKDILDDFTTVVLYADGALLLFNRRGYVGIDTTAANKSWFAPTYDKYDEKNKKWSAAVPIDPRGGLPRAAMYIDGLIWIGANVGDANGPFPKEKPMSKCWAGLDPKTGAFKRWVGYPPTETQWSGRCYWDIGSPDCILAQTLEVVSVDGKVLEHVRGVRGQCGMGFVVGHNAVFTSPNTCIYCYPMIRGAVSYELPDSHLPVADDSRLEKGPAYSSPGTPAAGADGDTLAAADVWPMYRGGTWRNGTTRMELKPAKLSVAWEAPVGGRCTQATAGKGKVVTAVIEGHSVVALNADTGKQAWEFSAGARVDTTPTICGDLCAFGAHDGYVYCLRLDDGALVWRFNAAPRNRRIVSGDQVSSPWPVVGSVLAHKGTLYATSGLYTPLDGAMHFWALDPATAKVKFHRELKSIRGEKATIMPGHWYIHQEDMLNNILLAQGKEIRLYDQHGGWELSADTGELAGQSQVVPQPGWPKGRLTPGEIEKADRWPWCGWDRVTMIHVLRGVEPGFGSGVGMDPRNRWADWYKGLYFVFPERGKTGIQLAKGNLNPIPWVLPATLDDLKDPKTWRATPPYKEAESKMWKSQRPGTGVSGMVFAGDTLWAAGSRGTGVVETAVHAVAMSDGTMTEACAFKGDATFDCLCAANGRLFVACNEGKVVCLSAKAE